MSVHRIEEQQLDAFVVVKSLYDTTDFIGTLQYIEQYTELKRVLLKAYEEVRVVFGGSPRLTLQVDRDPEGEAPDRLLLSIQTTADAGDALKKLDELDSNWWLGTSSRTRQLLRIDVEYI